MEYLEFELPIKELEEQLTKCRIIGEESDVDVTETCQQIEDKLNNTKKGYLQEPFAMAEGTIVKTP